MAGLHNDANNSACHQCTAFCLIALLSIGNKSDCAELGKHLNNDTIANKSYADCYYQNRSGIDEQAAEILQLISSYIGNIESISVLDVGSGPGRLAIPIGQKVNKIVCVEPDLLAVNYLRNRVEENSLDIEIYAKKIQGLSKENLGCFDLVMLSHIIHWIDVSLLLHLSEKFVKDNGYILLSYFDQDKLKDMLFYKVSGKQILRIQDEMTLSTPQLELKLSQTNFKIIHRVDIPISVNYGNGRLENIINSAGTLAWKKLQENFSENEYSTIKRNALNHLNAEPCLIDTEYRTTILAQKLGSSQ